MVIYRIGDTLTECGVDEALRGRQFVAVLNSSEWEDKMDLFDMGIEMDLGLSKIRSTHAEVNYDSLTGSFCLPGREAHGEDSARFAFALDEKGVVFIDDGDTALSIIRRIRQTKLWKLPSIDAFCTISWSRSSMTMRTSCPAMNWN